MIIGAHVSTAGGLLKAIDRGKEIGAEALQIFPSAPLRWKISGWEDETCQQFAAEWPKHFKQVVFHGIYLTNLAADLPQNQHLSKIALIDTLKLAAKLGNIATVFHPGNYKSGLFERQDQVKELIGRILAETPPTTKLIYENSAGSTIGGKLEDLAWLVENSSQTDRVGVCLDTCHAFAAGYDLKSLEGYQEYMAKVASIIGLEKVYCWHLNDSKFGLGSKRDRHANIGQGELGKEPFGWILNDQRWETTAGYLEVPGMTNQGPDKPNVQLLKKLRR
ncbi:MAG: deoxyribonuclease IV [Patescibacteria group bacterium]